MFFAVAAWGNESEWQKKHPEETYTNLHGESGVCPIGVCYPDFSAFIELPDDVPWQPDEILELIGDALLFRAGYRKGDFECVQVSAGSERRFLPATWAGWVNETNPGFGEYKESECSPEKPCDDCENAEENTRQLKERLGVK